MYAGVVELVDSTDLGSVTSVVCGFESRRPHQLRNSLLGTNPRLTARLLSRTGNFFASEPDSLHWIPVRIWGTD